MHFPSSKAADYLLLAFLRIYTCYKFWQMVVSKLFNAVSVILVGNSLNCTLMLFFMYLTVVVYNNGKTILRKKLLRSFGSVL